MKKERWKRCKIDSSYILSSFGRVFSLKRSHLIKPELLKSRADYYWRVKIGQHRMMLHVLMAIHFKKREDGQDQVNHLNLNTLDCAADNLAWATQGENLRYSKERRKITFQGKNYTLKRKGAKQ